MTFNSLEFCVFYVVFMIGFMFMMERTRVRNLFLLVSSYVFYACWDWRYLGLILGPTIVDYLVCLRMEKASERWRFRLLMISVVSNLGLLAIFKYYNFFMGAFSGLFTALHLDVSFPYSHLLLPVGISFYTFEVLSYTIDVYRGHLPAERNFITYATFVAFFPKLVAGPIIRASDLLPQLDRPSRLEGDQVLSGLAQAFRGLLKKVLIADMLAGLGVDGVFQNPAAFSSPALLLALYGYAIQIYCDFSGYSDIAIGIARTMGFEININFNRPYLSRSPSEFWRRWHISLSSWLRDYLYIPLGGSRKGNTRTLFNLMATMLIGGLWHGAAWNFIIWGGYHGMLLVIGRFYWPFEKSQTRTGIFWGRLITFHMICFGWLLFRVPNMEIFVEFIRGLFSFQNAPMVSLPFLIVLLTGMLLHFISQKWVASAQTRFLQMPLFAQAVVYLLVAMVLAGAAQQSPAFIYFQF